MLILRNLLSPSSRNFTTVAKAMSEVSGLFIRSCLLSPISLPHAALTYCDTCRHCLDCRSVSADFASSWPHQNYLGHAFGRRCGL
jgi:hypothetical protein